MLPIAIAVIGLALGETIKPNNNNEGSLIWYPVEVQSNSSANEFNNNLNANIFALYLYGLKNLLNQRNKVNCKDGCKQTVVDNRIAYPSYRAYPIYSLNPLYYGSTQYQNAYLTKIHPLTKSVMFFRQDEIARPPNNGGSTSMVDSVNENGSGVLNQEIYKGNQNLMNYNENQNLTNVNGNQNLTNFKENQTLTNYNENQNLTNFNGNQDSTNYNENQNLTYFNSNQNPTNFKENQNLTNYNKNQNLTNYNDEETVSSRILIDVSTVSIDPSEKDILDEMSNVKVKQRIILDYNEADLASSIENKIHSDTNHTGNINNVLEKPKYCLSNNVQFDDSIEDNDNIKTSISSSSKANTTIDQNDLHENENKRKETIINNRDNIEIIKDGNKTRTIQNKNHPGDSNQEAVTIRSTEQQAETDDVANARELSNFEIVARTDKNTDRKQIYINDGKDGNINKTETSTNRNKGITNYDYSDYDDNKDDADDKHHDDDDDDDDNDDDDARNHHKYENPPEIDFNINKSVQEQQILKHNKELPYANASEEERVTESETETETSTNKDKSINNHGYDIDSDDHYKTTIIKVDNTNPKHSPITKSNNSFTVNPNIHKLVQAQEASLIDVSKKQTEVVTDIAKTDAETSRNKNRSEINQGYNAGDDNDNEEERISNDNNSDHEDDIYKTKMDISDNTSTEQIPINQNGNPPIVDLNINKHQPTINANEEEREIEIDYHTNNNGTEPSTNEDKSLINQRYGTDDDGDFDYDDETKGNTADNNNTERTPINESKNSVLEYLNENKTEADTNQRETDNRQSLNKTKIQPTIGANLNERKIEKDSSIQLFKTKLNSNGTISADKNNKHNIIIIIVDNNKIPMNENNTSFNNSTNIRDLFKVARPFIKIIKAHNNLQDEYTKIRENFNTTSFFKKIKKCIDSLANLNDESSQNISQLLESCCLYDSVEKLLI